MIVRAGYRLDGEVIEDHAEGPDYETAKAALPERDVQRLWIASEH